MNCGKWLISKMLIDTPFLLCTFAFTISYCWDSWYFALSLIEIKCSNLFNFLGKDVGEGTETYVRWWSLFDNYWKQSGFRTESKCRYQWSHWVCFFLQSLIFFSEWFFMINFIKEIENFLLKSFCSLDMRSQLLRNISRLQLKITLA